MASWRSAPHPATWWLCSRTSTHLQPAASPSSLQTGCRRSDWPFTPRYLSAHCTTSTGTELETPVPSPSAPRKLSPQQYARRVVVKPQVCEDPALTARKVRAPATRTELDRWVVVPSPTWPSPLSPQQYATPPAVTPHACGPPALAALIEANLARPATGTGEVRSVYVLSPSSPKVLSPQQ